MGRIVFAVYRPHGGKETELLELVQEHMPVLKSQRLITDRKPMVMRANDNSIVEIFEWQSSQAIADAHSNPVVQELWNRFSAVCAFEVPSNVQEFHNMFSEFEPIN